MLLAISEVDAWYLQTRGRHPRATCWRYLYVPRTTTINHVSAFPTPIYSFRVNCQPRLWKQWPWWFSIRKWGISLPSMRRINVLDVRWLWLAINVDFACFLKTCRYSVGWSAELELQGLTGDFRSTIPKPGMAPNTAISNAPTVSRHWKGSQLSYFIQIWKYRKTSKSRKLYFMW